MVAPFSKIITKNSLVIILSAIVLIIVIAVIGFWIYKTAIKSISENFSVSVDDLDGTNAKTKIYFTKGLDDAVHKVSEIFGTIPNAEVFEDKLPGVCLDEDTICKGIKDPFKLPVKQDTDISGCGWYFAEDDDKVSFPAYGTKDGPLNPIMQKRAQGGQWYFKNLNEAQIVEDAKRCNRIKSCNIADLYPNQCAWCDTLGKAVPFDPDSKRSKYPDIDTISCNGRLVQDTDKCKQPNKKTAVINDKGQLSNTETVLKDVCVLRDGKLTSNCLAYIAKTAGVKETGKIARILNNDPEKYLKTGTENNRELMIVLNTLKRIDKLQWNFEFFGNGNCKRKDVISYYVNLVDLVTFGKTEESRSAAAWLVYGLPINFDLCTDKMLGPYTLTFVQRLFKKSGGQASGTSYPKEQDMYLYTGKKCSEIAMAFQKLCKEDMVSPDFQTRVKASQKCLGIQINNPADPNSPVNPKNPLNTSGINITTPPPNIPGCAEEVPPAAVVPNPYRFANPTALTGQNEVFHISGYSNHYWNADSKCSQYNGAKQATKKQLTESWNAGADWCSTGWVSDFHNPLYPSNVQLGGGCGNGKAQITDYMPPTKLAGVNCYGIKPVNGKYPEIKEFTPGVWYQRDYVKPPPVTPPAQGPILYEHCDKAGWSKTLPGVGKYRSDQGHFPADASFIVVPAGFRATIYTGTFGGLSRVIEENQSYNFCSEGSWANDNIHSILVERIQGPILYANCDKTGWSKTLPGFGEYRSDSGHYPADASFIVVPAGFRATIFTGIFGGQRKVIEENQSYNFCSEGSWANDRILSILVDTPGSIPEQAPWEKKFTGVISRYNSNYYCTIDSLKIYGEMKGIGIVVTVTGDMSLGPLQKPNNSKLSVDGISLGKHGVNIIDESPTRIISIIDYKGTASPTSRITFTYGDVGYSEVVLK